MAVAPEVLEEGAAAAGGGARAASEPGGGWQAVSRASGGLRRAPQGAWERLPSGGATTPAGQTIIKLVWAVALGLIMLEIAAQATGQNWSLALGQGVQGQRPQKGGYVPLYTGQSSAAAAMPGLFSGPVSVQSPATNLSGRAGGNLAMP